MSRLVPAPCEVRKQLLWTRVAVLPDPCVVFFGQVSKAVVSGEVQLACAATSICSRWHEASAPASCQGAAFKGQRERQPTVVS